MLRMEWNLSVLRTNLYRYPAPAPAPTTDGYVVTEGDNAVWGGSIDNSTYFLLGKLDSAQECLAAANASGYDVWTYHDTTVEPQYRKEVE